LSAAVRLCAPAAQVLSLLLQAAGFSLVHVMSGAATLAFLAACELLPDLILLDVSGALLLYIQALLVAPLPAALR
jgi:DNA-binding response OmpR family regulator